MSIGADLATARRQAGMSVAQVSEQTRIRESLIQAIERDDFSGCGADFYARGHIRAIAHATGMDAAPLVQEYDARRGAPPQPAGVVTGRPGPPTPGRGQPGPRRKRAWAVAALIVLVVALGLVIYRARDLHSGGGAPAAGGQPAAAHHAARKHKTTTRAAAHRGPHHLVISVTAVTEPCWAKLTRRGGATIFEGIIVPGTSKTWRVQRPVTLQLGNPAAVRLKIDGKRRTGLGANPATLHLRPSRGAPG